MKNMMIMRRSETIIIYGLSFMLISINGTYAMKTKNVHILPGPNGSPLYVLMTYSQYKELSGQKVSASKVSTTQKVKTHSGAAVPNEVLRRVQQDKVAPLRAWREYLGLTQVQVARRLNVTQGAYALTEKRENPRPSTLAKIAKAMKIRPEQLDI
ncbi:MAG: helix-turn-helix domain-containing protein [Burkholderiales bacterium]|jgi:DNA-binding XRE family transcriptional regulator|nr:helix-turn-helix domain-containing protein [Burkholderiales bacterium]